VASLCSLPCILSHFLAIPLNVCRRTARLVYICSAIPLWLPPDAGPLQAMGVSIGKSPTPPLRPASDHNSTLSGHLVRAAAPNTVPRQTQPPYGS
jgi:hypothetical protein